MMKTFIMLTKVVLFSRSRCLYLHSRLYTFNSTTNITKLNNFKHQHFICVAFKKLHAASPKLVPEALNSTKIKLPESNRKS